MRGFPDGGDFDTDAIQGLRGHTGPARRWVRLIPAEVASPYPVDTVADAVAVVHRTRRRAVAWLSRNANTVLQTAHIGGRIGVPATHEAAEGPPPALKPEDNRVRETCAAHDRDEEHRGVEVGRSTPWIRDGARGRTTTFSTS